MTEARNEARVRSPQRRRIARALTLALTLTLVLCGVARVGTASPGPAVAASARHSPRAARLLQRGLEHFVNREYQLAADDLMEAYRIDKRSATLLAWAEAVRATGDCELAKRIYGRLLEKTSELKQARQAELGIAACEAESAPPPTGTPGAKPATELAFGDVVATSPRPAARPRAAEELEIELAADDPAHAEDPAPVRPPSDPENPHATSYILMGSGGGAVLLGLAIYASAGNAPLNASHAVVTSTRSDGDWRRLIGASAAVVGGGVALVGIVRYRSENRRARDPALTLAPYIGAAGVGIAVSGGF